MTRIKRGFVARKRRKKVLNMAKGFRGSSSKLFRPAMQRVMKALVFAYAHRRLKKRLFRRLWIARINSAVRFYGLNYNCIIFNLKKRNCHINRKWLSQIAIREPELFKQYFVNTPLKPKA
jgi:large subunit ribosomal protein L20